MSLLRLVGESMMTTRHAVFPSLNHRIAPYAWATQHFCTKVQLLLAARSEYSGNRDGRRREGRGRSMWGSQTGLASREIQRTAPGNYGEIMEREPPIPTIGVVDDDESVRESLASLAESVGYEVVLFASAEEFLRKPGDRNDLDCLILDVRLPGMTGVELHSRLLASSARTIPTIFITAHTDPAYNAWAKQPGVVAVLYKPFEPEVLLQAVGRGVAQSRT
jgi:CheY-like chemotaxis protein